jgi:ABC-2 type transport system permease protein
MRTLYWAVRRELWENRYLYVTPLIVAGVALFAFLVGSIGLPARVRAAEALDPLKQQHALALPFSMAASVVFLFTYAVGAFYCLDALYGERRDRSILFWKSLPVSDLATVLSKAAIPLVVLPLFIFTIVIVTQLAMMAVGTLVLSFSGTSPVLLWTRVPLFRMTLVMVYGLVVHALWHAPLYAWLLLVSAWARRLPIVFALLPPVAISIVHRIAFGTNSWCDFMQYRLMGTLEVAFDFKAEGGIAPAVRPLNFLMTPGLWIGLAFAAGCLFLAVRLRRQRDPI